MKLDIKKIYIDSRFRTANSKSESDFNVELPRSFNVPDGVVAHIDDIVIPVGWRTVDERNNKCYVAFAGGTSGVRESNFTIAPGNYEGNGFATALAAGLNAAIVGYTVVPSFVCAYDQGENKLTISIVDARLSGAKVASPFIMEIYTDKMLVPNYTTTANTVFTILGNTTQRLITEAAPYTCYLDLFNTRNLYLTSSVLASYDTVSNFGMDTNQEDPLARQATTR
jgi:hypothetical protein